MSEGGVAYDPSLDEPEPTARSGADRVLSRHESRLMVIEGVNGCAVGSDEIGEKVILVFGEDDRVRSRVPKSLDGVEVRVEVTGPFDALSG